jgi:hydroxybutyrate-dimer hydrolase
MSLFIRQLMPTNVLCFINVSLSIIVLFAFSHVQPIQAKISLERPSYLSPTVIKKYFDGNNDDLLTAGWSINELAERKLPYKGDFHDPLWLRRAAYYNNIIALIDTTNEGGYGRIYGPLKNQPPIAGYEYLSHSIDQKGNVDASLMLQIPDNFDSKHPCIVVAASSGSRGIYGAVGTVGSWALTQRCAVAYTDKGTGTGFYFFDDEAGYDIQGRYIKAKKNNQSNNKSNKSKPNDSLLFSQDKNVDNERFLIKYPSAVSVKQAYSGKNIEKDWGKFVVQAGEFALYQLNKHYHEIKASNYTRKNTLVIAASISNGGGASLKAAEQDQTSLFDGVVAAEPNIYPKMNNQLSIYQGNTKINKHSLPGLEYFLSNNLFSPCSLLTTDAKKRPFFNAKPGSINKLVDWCNNLKKDHLIKGETLLELANQSLKVLTDLGIASNQQKLAPISQLISLWPAIALTYTNQIGKFKIEDNVCNAYFSAVDHNKKPKLLEEAIRLGLFSNSNGIPPTAGIALASNEPSQSEYEQAKCFYQLVQTKRIEQGINELTATSKLNKIPTIIIHGREDNLIAPNHTSRPYYANAVSKIKKINSLIETNIRYYEVTNAQHFDAFLSLPQFSKDFIPLHYYFEQSLDLMLAHLRLETVLPASQLIKTKNRSDLLESKNRLMLKHLPKIKSNPEYIIRVEDNNGVISLKIPD